MNGDNINLVLISSSNRTANEQFTIDDDNSAIINTECLHYIYHGFYESNDNKTIPDSCTIHYNSSYSIHFHIHQTIRNFFHLIESLNDWDKGTIYLIKTYPFFRMPHYKEYLIMTHLTQFCNDNECHTIKVFPNHYPFVHIRNKTKSYSIIFMQYLSDTINYKDFEHSLWSNPSTTDTLQFIDDCFKNISNVLDQLWINGLLHNDWHKENILVSKYNNHQCYLIDFNQMFEFINITHSDTKEYRGILSLQTPMSWHYLSTNKDRNKYIKQNGNNSFYRLKEFGYETQQYKVNIFILEALLNSKSIKRLNIDGNTVKARTYFKYVFNTITTDDNRRFHINSSHLLIYKKMQNIWCCRLEQIVYIIHLLKGYDNDNVNRKNILNNMFDLYYELKNELSQFDVVCNECILKDKYEDMNVKTPKFINYPLSI